MQGNRQVSFFSKQQKTQIKIARLLSEETIQTGDQGKIAHLLSYGADINSVDKRKRTALWWAASKGKFPLVKFLLKNGAELTEDTYGQSPLDVAREDDLKGYREPREENPYFEIVSLLSKYPLIKKNKQEDINSVTESMQKLELNATVPDKTSGDAEEKGNEPQQQGDWLCTLL